MLKSSIAAIAGMVAGIALVVTCSGPGERVTGDVLTSDIAGDGLTLPRFDVQAGGDAVAQTPGQCAQWRIRAFGADDGLDYSAWRAEEGLLLPAGWEPIGWDSTPGVLLRQCAF